jgi:hypothetical protein
MSTPPAWPPPPPPLTLPPGAAGAPPPYAMAPPPKKSSAVPLVIILIVVAFGGIFVLGIVAAIAIPGLLRARMSGNEAAAIGTIRAMSSAQAVWASGHNGRYAQPSCLGAPASCGDSQTPGVLMAEIASLEPRSGYDFGFVLRPSPDDVPTDSASATASEEAPGASSPGTPTDAEVRAQLEQFSTPDTGAVPARPAPSSRPPTGAIDPGGFVYWASPTTPRSTGSRRFCTDETGVVLVYGVDEPWTPPTADQPRCPDNGRPLQ